MYTLHDDYYKTKQKSVRKIEKEKLFASKDYPVSCPYSSYDNNISGKKYIHLCIIPNNAKINYMGTGGRGFSVSETDKIILGEKYCLSDVKTICKFNLKITEDYIKNICSVGNLETLKYIKNTNKIKDGCLAEYDPIFANILRIRTAVDLACVNGHTNTLTWLINNLPHDSHYTEWALYYASACGHINVLDWWRNSGLELKYNSWILNDINPKEHINVFNWWRNSGLELKYSEGALNNASSNGDINILDWWRNSGLELKYSKDALNWASFNGHINVLEWWFNSGLELKYDQEALYNASYKNHINVLEWWFNSGLPFKYHQNDNDFNYVMNMIYNSKKMNVLQLWVEKGYEKGFDVPFKYRIYYYFMKRLKTQA
jgi:hypothetical protein